MSLLDRRLSHQLDDKCCYGSCKERAVDGDYCAEHGLAERSRHRTKQASRRLKLAREGQCRDGCGRKVGKRYVGGRIVPRRCIDCKRADNKRRSERRKGRPGANTQAPVPTTQPRTKLEVQPDGYTRVRTIGRGTKAVTREDRDQNLRDELTWAISHLTWLRDEGIAALRSPSIAELGRIQRDEASRIVADRALEAARLARGVAREIHAKRVAEIDREIREALEADAEID